MADDNHSRSYRANNPQRRPERPAGQSSGNDPLAELARLIGQTDPFSDFAQGRAASQREQRQHEPRHPEPRHGEPRSTPPLDWSSAHEQYRQRSEPRARSQDYDQDYHGYAEPRADGRYAHEQFDRGDPYGDQQPQYAQRDQHYAPQGYAPQDRGAEDNAYGADPYYGQMPHDEDMYEQPRKARRGGLVTVMAVLALAVLGTAAAFGYRAVFGAPSVPATPPVIKASTAPTKVVPATQAGDPSGKLIYDRVGDPNQPERLVSREEDPVELKNAAQPRVVLPSGITPQANQSAPLQPQNAPAFAAGTPQSGSVKPPSSAPAAALTEPKKVRTVTIRPDQPDAPAPQPETAQTAPAPAADETPAAPSRATSAPRESAGQGESSAPLSLVPSGGNARAPGSAPMRTASAPPQHVPATAGLQGAYSVQVTSQRSEAEAQASYRALQAQFPNVLGAQRAVIRRADLGERGVYYRALVGSFESSGQASQFCRGLRDVGGQCVVQRN